MAGEARAGTPQENVKELVRRLIWNDRMPLEVVRIGPSPLCRNDGPMYAPGVTCSRN